jgi:hypothetical protein
MSTISFDGQSLIIDGKRVWLVSGSIHYARVPRGLWRDRVRAAKQAGLNCIDTSVFWNHHETKPGVFDFTGERDLRAFIQTIAQEGMYCILRPGPYVGSGWDFGGLPAWLLRDEPNIKLRQADPAFLSACSRYFAAVMDQVRDLQITAPHRSDTSAAVAGNPGGPIVLMQVEHEWHCFNPEQEEMYLRELVRYLRENGCNVPLTNANRLWQPIEGTFTTWSGHSSLCRDLRQLRTVQPRSPLVHRLETRRETSWASDPTEPPVHSPENLLHGIAEVLSAGAQVNLSPFHGGTHWGFTAGALWSHSPDTGHLTTSKDSGSPLSESGFRTAKYDAVKRIAVFQSQFGSVLANLSAAPASVIASPSVRVGSQISVVHLPGSQGDLVLIIRSPECTKTLMPLLLPDGTMLIVPVGDERVAWLLLGASLGGTAKLNHSTLVPWAFVNKKLLVLFGPASSMGHVTINQSELHVSAPAADSLEPSMYKHEGINIAVLSTEQIDATYLTPEGLVIGVSGLDEQNQPVACKGVATMTLVSTEGAIRHVQAVAAKLPVAPQIARWEQSDVAALLDGSSSAFKPIDKPRSHEALGQNFGYGWYRADLPKEVSVKTLRAPQSLHRLHLYADGELKALLGDGLGAESEAKSIRLKKRIVMLTDNLGRISVGSRFGQQTGLYGNLCDAKPIALSKPRVEISTPADPFEMQGFWHGLSQGLRQPQKSLVWSFKNADDALLLLRVTGFPDESPLVLNGQTIDMMRGARRGKDEKTFLLSADKGLKVGSNELKLWVSDETLSYKVPGFDEKTPLKLELFSAQSVTSDATWAFAPWSVPEAGAFTKAGKAKAGLPRWYRTTFSVKSTPPALWLETQGLSKGQIYVNGHNVGRYFQSTAEGDFVGPQLRYYLPEPWLRTDAPNELKIFDEHGYDPSKCRLVYTTESAFTKLPVKSLAKAATKPRVTSSSKAPSKSRSKPRNTKKR